MNLGPMRGLAATLASAMLVACAAHASHAGSATNANATQAPQVAVVGQLAPAWSEPLVSGGTFDSASLRGKPVYLNFFATWCPPCNDEAPGIEALYKKYGPEGIAIVGVDELESAAKAGQFVNEHRLTYPAVVDSGTLRDAYNINGLPVHVFIARNGIVKRIVVGEMAQSEIDAELRLLLASPA